MGIVGAPPAVGGAAPFSIVDPRLGGRVEPGGNEGDEDVHVQEAVRGDDARQAEAAPGRAAHHADQIAAPTPGRLGQPARIDEAHRAVGDVAVAVPALRRSAVAHQRVRAQEAAERRVVDAPPAMDESRPVQVLVARVAARAGIRGTRQREALRVRQRRRPVPLAPAPERVVGQRPRARAVRVRHALHRSQVVLVDVVHVLRRGSRLRPVIRR